MPESSSKVQSLTKGLKVLSVINDFPEASISQLVNETELPKATVIRLVQSLCADGYIKKLEGGSGYEITNKVLSLSHGVHLKSRYVEAANPVLQQLGSSLKWPSELLVRDEDTMVVEYDNRDTAPIRIQLFERRRFPLLESASGQVVLATQPVIQVEQLIRRLEPGWQKNDVEQYLDQLAQVAEQGYGIRDYDFLSPGLRAIAVPFFEHGRPIGAITLIHYFRYLPTAMLEQEVLPEMQHAAIQISKAL